MQDNSVGNNGGSSNSSSSEHISSGDCSISSGNSSRGSVAEGSTPQTEPIPIPIQILTQQQPQFADDPVPNSRSYSPSAATPGRPQQPETNVLKRSLAVNFAETESAKSSNYANGACANGTTAVAAAHNSTESPEFAKRNFSSVEKEIIRLIGQHLRNLGLHSTVDTLVCESQCELEYPVAARFRDNVLSGRWEKEMKFLILEQQYLELLEKGDVVDALKILREKLSPLKFSTERLHQLSSFLMYNNAQELRDAAKWDGCGEISRQRLMDKLQSFLPPSVMLPPRRLEQLLRQAVEYQRTQCSFHNTQSKLDIDSESLVSGHNCGRETFPCKTDQILNEHGDEVWFCRFNHGGNLLATGSKESSLIVWEADESGRFHKKHALDGHTYGAAYFAWSPDDRYIAVVGTEDCSELWIWNSQTGELRHKMSHSQDDSLSCVTWSPNSANFVCGGTKGQFYYCDLDGNIVNSFEGVRIRSVHIKKDGQTVLAADSHSRIRAYTFEDMADHHLIKEDHSIMNFTLDSTERYALVGLVSQGLHIWDIEDKCLLRRYRGVTQGFYNIYSCFGGLNEDYIASGSEDNNVHIWHRERDKPVVTLNGHTGVVNAVSWNPKDPSMLATCSDDGNIRIWRPSHIVHQNRRQRRHQKSVIDSCESEVTSTTTPTNNQK